MKPFEPDRYLTKICQLITEDQLDFILRYFIEKELFTRELRERIKNSAVHHTLPARCDALVDHLTSRDRKDAFLAALKEINHRELLAVFGNLPSSPTGESGCTDDPGQSPAGASVHTSRKLEKLKKKKMPRVVASGAKPSSSKRSVTSRMKDETKSSQPRLKRSRSWPRLQSSTSTNPGRLSRAASLDAFPMQESDEFSLKTAELSESSWPLESFVTLPSEIREPDSDSTDSSLDSSADGSNKYFVQIILLTIAKHLLHSGIVSMEIFTLLMEHETDQSTRQRQAHKALRGAACCGRYDAPNFFRQAAEFGFDLMDLNNLDGVRLSLMSAAILAPNAIALQALLAEGLPPNGNPPEPYPPLHFAAIRGNLVALEVLLEAGAHIDAFDEDYETALNRTVSYGRTDCAVALLRAGACVSCQASLTSRQIEETLNFYQSVRKGQKSFDNPQSPAALAASIQELEMSVERGRGGRDDSARHAAVRHCDQEERRADRMECVRLLLADGAPTEAGSYAGWTPLMVAARMGAVDAAKLLLKYGANPAATTRQGVTALQLASQSGSGEVEQLIMAAVEKRAKR